MADQEHIGALRHGGGRAVIEHEGDKHEVFVALSVFGDAELPPSARNAARWWGTVTGFPSAALGGHSAVAIAIEFDGRRARPATLSPPDRVHGAGDPLAT